MGENGGGWRTNLEFSWPLGSMAKSRGSKKKELNLAQMLSFFYFHKFTSHIHSGKNNSKGAKVMSKQFGP
jgi:hypothetical protein